MTLLALACACMLLHAAPQGSTIPAVEVVDVYDGGGILIKYAEPPGDRAPRTAPSHHGYQGAAMSTADDTPLRPGHAEFTCRFCAQSFYAKPSQKRQFCGRSCAMRFRHRGTPEQKFWERVKKGDSPDSCWEWTGARNAQGYGAFFWAPTSAHRFSYSLAHSIAIDDLPSVLMHLCDNPSCVNPAHLVPGSRKANTADRDAKGRTACGSRVGVAKLTEKQALEIKRRYRALPRRSSDGKVKRGRLKALAAEFGISREHVQRIAAGVWWSHLEET